MTASLPSEARDCFERFVTTELTTVDARQQPITWPVTPYYRQAPRRSTSRPASVVRAYKQLKMAERAFRTMKDQIEIRPIHHHLEERVRATPSFACSPTTSPSSCSCAWRR